MCIDLVPDEPKSICDLCGEVVLTRISTHMRENHPGCREKTDNKGYNSKGYYTNGWSGVCGEGGTENYSWYLLCSKCRKMYMLRNNMLHDDHGDLLAAPIDSFNIPSPVSSSFNCDFHITIKNNAMFLLTLSSSFPNPSKLQETDKRSLSGVTSRFGSLWRPTRGAKNRIFDVFLNFFLLKIGLWRTSGLRQLEVLINIESIFSENIFWNAAMAQI